MSNTPTTSEIAVLKRLATEETSKFEAEREERAAAIRAEMVDLDAEIARIGEEHQPIFAEMDDAFARVQEELAEVHRARAAADGELCQAQAPVRAKRGELKAELRRTLGLMIIAPPMFETEAQCQARKRAVQQANVPALRPDARP